MSEPACTCPVQASGPAGFSQHCEPNSAPDVVEKEKYGQLPLEDVFLCRYVTRKAQNVREAGALWRRTASTAAFAGWQANRWMLKHELKVVLMHGSVMSWEPCH